MFFVILMGYPTILYEDKLILPRVKQKRIALAANNVCAANVL
jgi:hypothetical protein